MRRFLVACAVLALPPLSARAQIAVTSTKGSGAPPTVFIGHDACTSNTAIDFTWNITGGVPQGEELHILRVRSSGTCTTTSVSDPDKDDLASPQGPTGTVTFAAQDLIVDQSADGGFAGGCANTTRDSTNPWTTHVCVQLRPQAGLSGTTVATDVPVKFSMLNPAPPIGVTADPGDKHLKVRWASQANTSYYDVHVLAQGDAFDPAKRADRVTSTTSSDVTRTDLGSALQNDVPYTVQIVATDLYSNVSAPSAPVTGTPVHVNDFYSQYRNDNGSALGGGGCSTGGVSAWVCALALVAGFLARRRAGAGKSGAALLIGLFALGGAARAQERPPRKWMFAFKMDKYKPRVDSEPGLTGTPYKDIFGTGAPLRYQLEADYEVWHPLGSVLVGLTAGFWQTSGKGRLDNGTVSTDSATLNVAPIGAVATYRFDWAADRWIRFPFIPYAQAGVTRALWASFSGTGSVSKDSVRGGRGSGWTWGYTGALGLALNLDAIDPELAREAYLDTGIQRSTIFAEYGWTQLDNFGKKSGTLILSDRAWRFGLALEF